MKRWASVFIYLSGMVSLFLVDFIIVRFESTETISNWATIKSVVMIGGTLALLGMDQVMVRLPEQSIGILKRSYFQVIIAVLIYSLVVFQLGLLTEGISLVFAILAMAMSTLHFGYLRSHFLLILAQVVTNGWKILFLLILCMSIYLDFKIDYSVIYVISILITLIFVFTFKNKTIYPQQQKNNANTREQYELGARFFISLLSLNLSLYLEQVLLNAGNHIEESSIYFSHFTVILPLIMLFNGYIGFILGPYIRKNTEKFELILKKYWWVPTLFSISLGALSYLISNYIFLYFLEEKTTFLPHLALIITLIGSLRIMYILPSSYLGVVASKEDLDKFIIINSISIGVLVGSFYLFYQLNNDALYSIAYASLLNWLIRTTYGNYLVWTIWKTRTLGKVYE